MRNPRCVITFPVPASGRALESWASLGLLHDLHESAGVEDLQFPLGERRPEFVPANHFDPLVSAFRELDPVRAFYAAWSKPLLLRLLNGGFDAHRFHDQVNPSGTRPHNRPLTDASRGQYIIVVRTRSSRETFYRGALCRNMVRFGSSGIRGLGNVEVTPELALRVGSVIGELYGDSVIGRDPRTTGPMLVQAFAAGVLSTGSAAVDAGLVSTPTLARGARDFACGAMITASHNPAPYNGIKLWNPDGMAFDEDQQREIEEGLDRGRAPVPSWDHVGEVSTRADLVEQHVEAILKDAVAAKVRVVVDCACGATATITPFLLRQMGCDVVAVNAQADGHFPGRDPEPLEENLAVLSSTVRAVRADLGIAHDGDGDRMVAVDRE